MSKFRRSKKQRQWTLSYMEVLPACHPLIQCVIQCVYESMHVNEYLVFDFIVFGTKTLM